MRSHVQTVAILTIHSLILVTGCGSPAESSEPGGPESSSPEAAPGAQQPGDVGTAHEALSSWCTSTFGAGHGALVVTAGPTTVGGFPTGYGLETSFLGYCFSQGDRVAVGIADESNGKVYGAAAFTAGADNGLFPGAVQGNIFGPCLDTTAHLVAFDASANIIAKSSSFNGRCFQ